MNDIPKLGLKVKQITPLCQLQDLGRFGYQNYGVTHCGAIDPYLLRVANILIGNPQGMACLEFTLAGGEFICTAHSLRISFAGDFPVSINGISKDSFCSLHLKEGDCLHIGSVSKNIRGYLAVAGGFCGKKELGSYSSHTRSGLGSFAKPTKVGSTLPTNESFAPIGREHFFSFALRRKRRGGIRVVLGPQESNFTEKAIKDFFTKPFSIAQNSDRMGYRLEGNIIEHAGDGNIISDPVVPGSIQVPAVGNPVVLMADCPTTGGYPKIGTIISVDRGVLAQIGPGSEVAFEPISVEDAQMLRREEEKFFRSLSLRLDRY